MFKFIFAILISSNVTMLCTGQYSFEPWNSRDPATNIPEMEDYENNKYFSKSLLTLKQIKQI